MCTAVFLGEFILNVDLFLMLPKCCLGSSWVSVSQVHVSPVQRTPTDEIFRIWTLNICCMSSQLLCHLPYNSTSVKRHPQLTNFHVHRCSHSYAVGRHPHTGAAKAPQGVQTIPMTPVFWVQSLVRVQVVVLMRAI